MVETNVERFLIKRAAAPTASGNMASQVSQYRREILEEEVANGSFVERGNSGSRHFYDAMGKTGAGNVLSSGSFFKTSQAVPSTSGAATGGGFRGSGGTFRQVPEIYSPLWLNSNLNLPRDRATINAWARAFFALNPFVQNAITLHSTYPISKLSIKCKDEKVQAFFEGMIEETDLMNVCIQIAQEYWLLGEAFVYAELDERSAKWSRFIIQNPDYVTVKHSVIVGEPVLSLRPDENLKRIITSNRPSDIQQRQRLDKSIIEHVRRGENIPLGNFYASHIARRLNPYDTRGTGLTTSCFRNLMLFDKLRECYSTDCEVLTRDGFKKIIDLIATTKNVNTNPNYVNGTFIENGELNLLTLRDNVEVACFNQETGEIEYHIPEEFHMSYHKGKMLNFKGEKIDTLVTPNHKMLVKEKKSGAWSDFELRKASDLLKKKTYYKFRCHAKWNGEQRTEDVGVAGHKVPIGLYLKTLGYMVSEGCVYRNFKKGRYDAKIITGQLTKSRCYEEMRETFNMFASCLDRKCGNYVGIKGSGYSKNKSKEKWEGVIHGKDIVEHFLNEIGNGEKAGSHEKRLPRWVFGLHSELLLILLQAMMQGDGTISISKYGTESKSSKYSTVSKNLADDVYEIVFKLGFVPTICTSVAKKSDGRVVTEYIVCWSTTDYGREPNIYTGAKKSNNNGGGATVEEVDYDDVVWCFTVPTGAFVTRRNNRISIHGNSKFSQADNMINPLTLVKVGSENFRPSPTDLEAYRQVFEEAQYDKDFKIFTHNDVIVERIGHNTGIIDISADIEKLTKEIYIGLMVPQVLMDGGSDVTYANGGVTLDVLRQRYMSFRNMLSSWLRRKIFAPISKINDFYEYKGGDKILTVPEVEWNHMSLFDAGDYIQVLMQLVQGTPEAPAKVSTQTLYRSLGLDWEDEVRKLRVESIQNIIHGKESEALTTMSLNELRALGPDDTIDTPVDTPVPGEEAAGETGVPPEVEGGLDLGLPGMGAGPPPEMGAGPPPEMGAGGEGEAAPLPEAGPAPGGGGGAPPV